MRSFDNSVGALIRALKMGLVPESQVKELRELIVDKVYLGWDGDHEDRHIVKMSLEAIVDPLIEVEAWDLRTGTQETLLWWAKVNRNGMLIEHGLNLTSRPGYVGSGPTQDSADQVAHYLYRYSQQVKCLHDVWATVELWGIKVDRCQACLFMVEAK